MPNEPLEPNANDVETLAKLLEVVFGIPKQEPMPAEIRASRELARAARKLQEAQKEGDRQHDYSPTAAEQLLRTGRVAVLPEGWERHPDYPDPARVAVDREHRMCLVIRTVAPPLKKLVKNDSGEVGTYEGFADEYMIGKGLTSWTPYSRPVLAEPEGYFPVRVDSSGIIRDAWLGESGEVEYEL